MIKKITHSIACFSILGGIAYAQTTPVAQFFFENNFEDSLTTLQATNQGTSFTFSRYGDLSGAKSLKFSNNSKVNLGNRTDFNFTSSFTIDLWTNLQGSGTGSDGSGIIISKEGELEIATTSTGEIMYAVSTTDQISWEWVLTGKTLSKGSWQNLVFNFHNGVVNIFLDGANIHTKNYGGTIDEATTSSLNFDDLVLGGRDLFVQGFNGFIDDVTIYNLTLSETEVNSNYQKNKVQKAVAQYSFDGNTEDLIGDNDGLNNGCVLTTDRFNNSNSAYSYSSSSINLGDSVEFNFTDAFSISMWVNQTGNATSTDDAGILISKEGELEIAVANNGEIRLAVSTTAQSSWAWQSTGIILNKNTWYNVVFEFGNGEARIFINGENKYKKTYGGTIDEVASNTNTYDDLILGDRDLFTQHFNGIIDDVTIYNTSLNPSQITENYNVQKTSTVTSIENENLSVESLKIFPIPCQGLLNFNSVKDISSVEFFNTNGDLVQSSAIDENAVQLNVQKGLYIAKVIYSDGNFETQKIVIE